MDKKEISVEIAAVYARQYVIPIPIHHLAEAVAQGFDNYVEFLDSEVGSYLDLPNIESAFGLAFGTVKYVHEEQIIAEYDILKEHENWEKSPHNLGSFERIFGLPAGFYIDVFETIKMGEHNISVEMNIDLDAIKNGTSRPDRWHFGPTGLVMEIELFDLDSPWVNMRDQVDDTIYNVIDVLHFIPPRPLEDRIDGLDQIREQVNAEGLDATNPARVTEIIEAMLR